MTQEMRHPPTLDPVAVSRGEGEARWWFGSLAVTKLTAAQTDLNERLEALKGNRQGQHSIRVNDQWRICFVWTAEGPKDVEFVDYHR